MVGTAKWREILEMWINTSKLSELLWVSCFQQYLRLTRWELLFREGIYDKRGYAWTWKNISQKAETKLQVLWVLFVVNLFIFSQDPCLVPFIAPDFLCSSFFERLVFFKQYKSNKTHTCHEARHNFHFSSMNEQIRYSDGFRFISQYFIKKSEVNERKNQRAFDKKIWQFSLKRKTGGVWSEQSMKGLSRSWSWFFRLFRGVG